jgi:probable DNA metabolism protein
MLQVAIENNFTSWRDAARRLLANAVPPNDIVWSCGEQNTLFGSAPVTSAAKHLAVPSAFVRLAEGVSCFDGKTKWPLLYRLLFRIIYENRSLLEIESDPDVVDALRMEKAVSRDVHKFHAFVRFRQIECGGEEIYGAWYEPHHFTVERATPFFARRFGAMRWSIFTPRGCAHWDLKTLTFSEPALRSQAPAGDEMEEFWLLYYKSIFNPFRLKVNAMKKEFPKRHWPTLPEAVLIPELIRSARGEGEPPT